VVKFKLVSPVGIGAVAETVHVRPVRVLKERVVNPVGIGAVAETVHINPARVTIRLVNPVGIGFAALIVPLSFVSRKSSAVMSADEVIFTVYVPAPA